MIQDTASSSSLCALIAARERATKGKTNEIGCRDKMTVYVSNQAHSSIEKAVMVSGLGRKNMRLINVDESFAMKPNSLQGKIEQDIKDGIYQCMYAPQ